jgi:hypothetical protein
VTGRGRQENDAVLADGKIDTGAHCNAIKKVWCSSPTVPFFGINTYIVEIEMEPKLVHPIPTTNVDRAYACYRERRKTG